MVCTLTIENSGFICIVLGGSENGTHSSIRLTSTEAILCQWQEP